MYKHLVKTSVTKYNLSIEDLHEIGISETERVLGLMINLKDKLPIKDITKHKPFYLNKKQEVLDAYKKHKKEINKRIIPKYFGDLRPPVDYEIKAVPKFNEEFAPTAYYMSPSIDKTRKGVFSVNLRNLHEHPTYNMEVLTLHEGCPGHHYQISIAETNKTIPKFRSYASGLTAYIEGWGLYTENLGEYKDGYSKIGKYNYELMRSIRLIVDTGIHYFGWSFEKARKLLKESTDLVDSEIDSEIYRYIAMPGQALAYKIGELSILNSRRKYLQLRKEEDSDYDENKMIIDFHKKIINLGALPLWLLEVAILE
jgi:uncharacterized protein (DUF885 family)